MPTKDGEGAGIPGTTALEAMVADPTAGSLPDERVVAMTDELSGATAARLPQFTRR